jgi:hypothetical protein
VHQHWVLAGLVQQSAVWHQGEAKPRPGARLTPESKDKFMPSDQCSCSITEKKTGCDAMCRINKVFCEFKDESLPLDSLRVTNIMIS